MALRHPLQFGADRGSPIEKLVELRGKVLLIGSDPDRVTLLHYAEGLADIDDKRTVRIKVPLSKGGERVWTEVIEHDSSNGVRPWPEQFFADIVRSYVQESGVAATTVGDADVRCFDARTLVEYAKIRMERMA